ncbi:conserved hypothetical protein [Streptomyces himastatinicus ATCC 53653]|uniref:Uncharacterized protein n=1 Tax=Streptomyces himastatinicus ATCC 53653 TaxID=457427 RepID=D9W6E2_9ACTN|nr:glycoside hydrolase family 6 protein [Streptomyces himastatinicus]EFL22473.1 conserved hypothetical protein [Streptomyces himastatinicus ATCC 53653]
MVRTPQAVWYGDESPARVARLVRMTTRDAARRDRLPVLALYNVPGRDCGSYSAGGARDHRRVQGVDRRRGRGHRRPRG